MNRYAVRGLQAAIDLAVLALAFVLAHLLRFDWELPRPMAIRMVLVLPYAVLLQYAVLFAFGVPRYSWRYVGLREVVRVALAVGVAAAVLLAIRYGLPLVADGLRTARWALVPAGVVVAYVVLAFLGIIGVRVLRRMASEKAATRRHRAPLRQVAAATPTILVGAGQGGLAAAREISSRPDLAIRAVAFVDDDPLKVGSLINGIEVAGTTMQVDNVRERTGATQALITISNAPGHAVREITKRCRDAGLEVKILPGLHEIVGGKVNLSRIRPIAIEDLLRREPVELEAEAIRDFVRDTVVLVTGAGGSIGSELCRQIARLQPRSLILAERAENALFHIHRELTASHPDVDVVPRIVDICCEERVREVFSELAPAVVFHAAAHKHVPMMEWNASEAVRNNVFGTKTVADCAKAAGARAFVMISTDKAVNPTSVMGATKRFAEMYVQTLDAGPLARFVTVRFGNVLGSNGSVVPIFQDQIRAGGPITITHLDMQRYFLTIPEACQLVLQAATMGRGREIFVLDMGKPVRILDLAKDLIELSGLRVEDDIEIEVTGLRPGEKLFEELAFDDESATRTRHPKIYIGRARAERTTHIDASLDALREAVHVGDAAVRDALRGAVPEYQASGRSTSGERHEPPVAPTTSAPAWHHSRITS